MSHNVLSRRNFIIAGAAIGGAALLAGPVQANVNTLPFLVVGDWGDPSEPAQRIVAASMGEVATRIESAFVISTGDNFYHGGVESVSDPHWREAFESVYTAPSLQTPWYSILGNHDYEGSAAAQVAYTRESSRWRMPSRYFREDRHLPDGARATFFFLDTTPITMLSGIRDAAPQADFGARDQIMWLERVLASCTSDWKIVVGHHPIFSSGRHGPSATLAHHVRPLLERYGVQAYFNGHDHDLEHLRFNGVDYICSGSGSETRDVHPVPESRFARAQNGFVACNLSRDALQVRFLNAGGETLYDVALDRV
jgi:acid phosphatase